MSATPSDPSVRGERAQLDVHGSLLLTAFPLLVAYAVVSVGEADTSPWTTTAALVGAAAAAAGFARIESRSWNPLIPLAFFADRPRVRANLTTMLLSAALSTSFLLFTFYLQDRLGIGPLGAGLTMLPLAVALVVSSMLIPRLLERWGAVTCVRVGLAATAAAMSTIGGVAVMNAGAAWLLSQPAHGRSVPRGHGTRRVGAHRRGGDHRPIGGCPSRSRQLSRRGARTPGHGRRGARAALG
ncbi:major facilitator superfamily permease [Gordonia neofelifaecis]|uniref:Major facilitator superfamily permease n=1 Tax=Gordonia neofelifaecis NRRL B-59395 TaxID=644548 RepID=F1YPN4_9ACTN|nr:major facilitator superfamily permease [Gordonia neofelifaecis]EGD53313.1 major facilitator superfamily permease [Gordonia neofelifaecis NRRL B-59395]